MPFKPFLLTEAVNWYRAMSRYEATGSSRREVEVIALARADAAGLKPRQTLDSATAQADYDMAYDFASCRVRLIHLSGDDYARVAGARNEGRQAGQKARTLNPYRRDGAEWAAWLTGWLDARNEDQ